MAGASGASGRLLVAGRVAARLANWTLEHREGSAVVHAQVAERDAYLLSHARRFDLHLDIGKRGWRWRGVDATVTENGARIEARGKPEGG